MNELGNTPADKNYKPSGTSKEEQLCAACCPYYGKIPDQCGYTERKMQWDCPYFDFIERGYEQAEKDLALTWEDLELLHRLFAEEEDNFSKHDKYFYADVLTRFKQFKEGNNDQD